MHQTSKSPKRTALFPTVMSLDDDGWSRLCSAAALEKQMQKLYENESHSHATALTINDALDTQSLADPSKKGHST
jgi:hypothetical protein